MRFGKRAMFLVLNGISVFLLTLYFSVWLFSSTVMGTIQRPYQSNIVVVQYTVEGQLFTGEYMRTGIPFTKREVEVRYFWGQPSFSRINSFLGIAAEPLAWGLLFAAATAMLLLTNNTVFSKGTRFQLHKTFPYLSMDEYFPAPVADNNYSSRRRHPSPPVPKRLQKGNGPATDV